MIRIKSASGEVREIAAYMKSKSRIKESTFYLFLHRAPVIFFNYVTSAAQHRVNRDPVMSASLLVWTACKRDPVILTCLEAESCEGLPMPRESEFSVLHL